MIGGQLSGRQIGAAIALGVLLASGCAAPLATQWARTPVAATAAALPMTATPPELHEATPPPAIMAQNFSLLAVDGTHLSLHDLRGRWVIVNFWATWCVSCREELPYLQSLAETNATELAVLGINMRENAETLSAFLTEFMLTFPILTQPDDATLLWYGLRGLPLTYVIAPDGTVAYQQYGPLQPEHFNRWLADRLAQ